MLYYGYLSFLNKIITFSLRGRYLAVITFLIGIVLFILYTISLLVSSACNYRSFGKVMMISQNAFFGIMCLRSRGDVIALRLPLAIWAYMRLVSINYCILVEFLILFSITSIKSRRFPTFLIRFRLEFNGRT